MSVYALSARPDQKKTAQRACKDPVGSLDIGVALDHSYSHHCVIPTMSRRCVKIHNATDDFDDPTRVHKGFPEGALVRRCATTIGGENHRLERSQFMSPKNTRKAAERRKSCERAPVWRCLLHMIRRLRAPILSVFGCTYIWPQPQKSATGSGSKKPVSCAIEIDCDHSTQCSKQWPFWQPVVKTFRFLVGSSA